MSRVRKIPFLMQSKIDTVVKVDGYLASPTKVVMKVKGP